MTKIFCDKCKREIYGPIITLELCNRAENNIGKRYELCKQCALIIKESLEQDVRKEDEDD